jgi:pyrroline-5-carboxylate reductase
MISIAAGVKSHNINAWLGGGISIVRTMPNTPALVGEGATGMVANDAVSNKQKTLAEQILGSVGEYVCDECAFLFVCKHLAIFVVLLPVQPHRIA